MFTFYGQIQGQRTTKTTIGSKTSGIKSSVQSYDGSVIMKMYDINGVVKVDIQISDISSFYGDSYFYGTIDELKECLKRGISGA